MGKIRVRLHAGICAGICTRAHLARQRRLLRAVIGALGEQAHRALAQPGAQTLKAGQRALPGHGLLEQMGAGAGPGDHLVGP